jgi:hypothetical protein
MVLLTRRFRRPFTKLSQFSLSNLRVRGLWCHFLHVKKGMKTEDGGRLRIGEDGEVKKEPV